MTSQPVPSGTFMIVTPSGISVPQMEQPGPSSESNNNLKKGLKEESKALGTIQTLTGLMILGMGIILACAQDSTYFKPSYSKITKSGYPFIGGVSKTMILGWAPSISVDIAQGAHVAERSRRSDPGVIGSHSKLFIISGSLSIASEKKKTKSLTHISLAANVISGIVATAGLILFSAVLPELKKEFTQCIHQVLGTHQQDQETQNAFYTRGYHLYRPTPSPWACHMAGSAFTGTLSVMLIFTGLELSVAVFAAFFDWRRLSAESNGRVLFLPHGRHINSSLRTTLYDPAYKELGAST
ncbi:membrane-spanning 4-domains subfamily A member 6A isoform X1 [Vombatus ursinus]|uniref:membrane-spanning 4-domains subfamily A member 6A isoform X1 n=1 Tax=Vombatus ursinus TaxID=29139 RepID=UPI000FFD06EF|nr:membrane-spanning 4-domains subfamily A member 6A isoform X1 [Vombatus ursinus]